MKSIWQYISLTLGISLIGICIASFIFTNKWKDKLIECQEQLAQVEYVYVHDTVTFEKPVVHWKTKHDTTEIVTLDTLYSNDTVTIIKEISCPLDSFSVTSGYNDSVLDATVYIEGRGVNEKTFLDSIFMDYKVNTEVLVPKKKCSWWRRFWCGCN